MNAPLRQWDIVLVRIDPADRNEHPAIIISPEEVCEDPEKNRLNALYGTTRRPGDSARAHEAMLNGAEGLERPTLFSCAHFYTVDRRRIASIVGRVAHERRIQIARKLIATFRLPL